METKPRQPELRSPRLEQAARLNALLGEATPQRILELSIGEEFVGSIAAVSSFGADSAVLLDMIGKIDHNLPVLFLDTGKHFEETIAYRDALASDFRLRDIRIIHPDEHVLATRDPDGRLHQVDTEACCEIRKVEPLAQGLKPFEAWITGRKQFQAATRQGLQAFEAVGDRIRINPLARWTTSDLANYMRRHALRANPLVAYGYLSIGCFPCTQPVKPGEDARSGRWAGQAKTECGIHLSGLDQSLTEASL
jgi:phosphoadenosine phosphosulfate reductase